MNEPVKKAADAYSLKLTEIQSTEKKLNECQQAAIWEEKRLARLKGEAKALWHELRAVTGAGDL